MVTLAVAVNTIITQGFLSHLEPGYRYGKNHIVLQSRAARQRAP
jgi:hypothetical protein